MKNLLKSTEDFNELKLKDVMDLDFIQKFQDNFAKSMNIACAVVDDKGNIITKPSYFTEFCGFTQSTSGGSSRCAECSKKGGEEAFKMGKPVVYRCHAGLVDFTAPIMIEGKLLGSIVGGQVLIEPPNEEKIIKISEQIGVDKERYISAIRKVKSLEEDSIKAAAEVLFILATTISKMGYQRYKLKHVTGNLSDNFEQISSAMEELAASSINVSENQRILNEEIYNVQDTSKAINKVLDSIKGIASQTKMLGLNASIEAARAGDVGRGFGVVAVEIRKLSDDSKETADSIGKLTSVIQKSVNNTIEMSKATLSTTEQQASAIQEVTANVGEVMSLTEQLHELASSL